MYFATLSRERPLLFSLPGSRAVCGLLAGRLPALALPAACGRLMATFHHEKSSPGAAVGRSALACHRPV